MDQLYDTFSYFFKLVGSWNAQSSFILTVLKRHQLVNTSYDFGTTEG